MTAKDYLSTWDFATISLSYRACCEAYHEVNGSKLRYYCLQTCNVSGIDTLDDNYKTI